MKLRTVRIQTLKNKAVIADKCSVAESFWSRFVGLMGKSGLKTGEGLWLRPCNSIHMGFMRFPIDVVFICKDGRAEGEAIESYRVTSVRENVRPWALLPISDWKAQDVLELPAGSIAKASITVGDQLCIS